MSQASTLPAAADPELLAELSVELVASYVAHNAVPAAEVPALIRSMYDTLNDLEAAKRAPQPAKPAPAVSIQQSMTDDYLVSLEDGKRYKSLKRHLTGCGLTPDEYRAKWGLPADYPMVSPAYARKRSELARTMGLGSLRKRG